VIPRLPIGAWTESGVIGTALRAAGLPVGLLREHGLLARYVPNHPLLFLYEDAEGFTGFKCRKPVLGQKSVLNALGFGGAVEGRSVFGVSVAREAIAQYRRAIVVEGEFDALVWYSASLAVDRAIELVALGGSAKSTVGKFQTLRTLGARVVYLALDADAAGEASTASACRHAWEAGLDAAVLSMPAGCKDPDEVLARHGPNEGARFLFALDRAEPGAVWLTRYQLSRLPPLTLEQAARLREESAEAAQIMLMSGRPRYTACLAEALGVPTAPLAEERTGPAVETRAQVRRWFSQWLPRLDQGILADRLDEALTVLTRTRTCLSGAGVEAAPQLVLDERQPPHA